MTPILKWVGGKTQLLPHLVKRMPPTYGRYYEPFAGGAALYFHLEPRAAVLCDQNVDLIRLYDRVGFDAEPIIRRLREHKAKHRADGTHYYAVRERWNKSTWQQRWGSIAQRSARRAADFVYLNRTCFNGLFRVNKAGAFNVPIGRYVNPLICDADNLRRAQTLLVTATLRTGDYTTALGDVERDDFVYFDPPYVPKSPTANFTKYSIVDFNLHQHERLRNTAKNLIVQCGAKVMLSNSDTPIVRELYGDRTIFQIHRVRCKRSINAVTTKRGCVNEVIITGGYDMPSRRAP